MKKIFMFGILAMTCWNVNAQWGEPKKDPTYKVEAVQKINADIYQLAFNTENNNIYVAGPRGKFKVDNEKVSYPDKQYVYVLDGNTLVAKDSIAIENNFAALGVGINNRTQTLYVGHSFNQAITAIDLKSKKQTLIPSGRDKSKIREVVVDEVNNLVYVSDHGDPSIWVVDGKTNKFKTTISAPGSFPTGLAVDPVRNRIYTVDGSTPQGNVLAFDTKSHSSVGKWKTWGGNPLNIAIDYKNNRIFVVENGDSKVSVLDGKSGEIITKISLGQGASPVGLVYDTKNDLLYVAHREKQEVAVLDAKTYKLIERIPTKGLPNTIVLNPANGAIYVTNKAPHSFTGKAVVLENGNTVQKITKM